MSPLFNLVLLSITPIIAYLFSLTNLIVFLPQLIALISILFILFQKYHLSTLSLVSLIINLIIFTSGGVSSPFFFLIYFLLFITAITSHPLPSLTLSLVVIFFLCHSLNSLNSLLSILSLVFITPVVWFVARSTQKQFLTQKIVAQDETDFLFWLNLKFKNGISTIIDSASQLQSTPLSYGQKNQLKKIKDNAHSLLHSSENLTDEISSQNDEI